MLLRTLRCPAGVLALAATLPLPAQGFSDVTSTSGLLSVPHSTVAFGSGIACGDFDGDGDLDLVMAGNPGQPLYYFRNDGGFVFSDQSATAGLGNAATVHGFAVGDIDNDGDRDLFVCNWRGPAQLFVNDGSGRFTEQAAARGITHATSNFSANFGDYDRDGLLDLYIGNRADPAGFGEANILYRNTGGGYFADVTAAAGVGHQGMTFASAFMDYDEDGWPDIAVINDKGTSLLPNEIYRNNGNGTFSPVAAAIGAAIGIDGMGIDYLDVFNDGGVDFYASDSPIDHLFMHWDAARGRYVDDTYTYGLIGGGVGWAVNWFDYDNDGWQDLHVVHIGVPNHVYHNPGRPAAVQAPWPQVATSLGLGQPFSQYSAVFGDFDNDGGVDVIHRYAASVLRGAPNGIGVMRNNTPRGNWLKFRTVGTASNRDGIGARILVDAGGIVQRQWVRSGVGFMASSDLRVHFGLGTATRADRVEITWPSGQVQYLTGVVANRIVTVVEPSLTLRAPARVGATTHLDLSVPGDGGLAYGMGLALSRTPPTPLPDGRLLPLRVDDLTVFTLVPGNSILPGGSGALDSQGRASSPLHLPNLPFLAGTSVFATAATFDPPRFAWARTLFPRALEIRIR